jgi:hypothetical protein
LQLGESIVLRRGVRLSIVCGKRFYIGFGKIRVLGGRGLRFGHRAGNKLNGFENKMIEIGYDVSNTARI